MRRALRRRYGHGRHRYGRSQRVGHIEVALISGGRWAVTWVGGAKDAPVFVGTRGEAIKEGQKEAKQRGIPFLMGI